jgi:hypothetical protein
MSIIRCPVCNRSFETETAAAMPFCSDRCRKVDLGRWLDERYSVPVERDSDDFDEAEG